MVPGFNFPYTNPLRDGWSTHKPSVKDSSGPHTSQQNLSGNTVFRFVFRSAVIFFETQENLRNWNERCSKPSDDSCILSFVSEKGSTYLSRCGFWRPRVLFITLLLYISIWTGAGISHTVGIIWYNHCVAVCQPGEQHSSWLSQWFYEMDMNNKNSSPTPGGPCHKSVPHDGGAIIVYALPRVFREATGKQRFRETFRGASATAVPASAKVLELTSLTKLFLGDFDHCSNDFTDS